MGIGGIGGVNRISGIGRMQDYSIQMPQPAKTVIVEETGAESHVASSEQINSGNSGAAKEKNSGSGEEIQRNVRGHLHYVPQTGRFRLHWQEQRYPFPGCGEGDLRYA